MNYTLLEAAQKLGFTKNAVKYHIKKLPPEQISADPTTKIIHITEEGLETLAGIMGRKKQPDKTEQEPDNNHEEPPINRVEPDNKLVDSRITTEQEPNINHQTTDKETTAFTAAITALTAQLAVKDEQIAALNRQIETLSEALRAAQNTAAAAQALHAGTIQNERLTAPLDAPERTTPAEDEENKKNETAEKRSRRWWQRFGK
jgi:hypothetical protein